MNAIDIISKIFNLNKEIIEIKFHRFPQNNLLQDRVKFELLEKEHFDQACQLKKTHNVPFWDAMLLSYFNKGVISDKILESILNHNKIDAFFTVNRVNISSLYEIINLKLNTNLAFNSEVLCANGEKRHFPLLDFYVPFNDKNTSLVKKVIKLLALNNGYLLSSGQSYHFIGSNLITSIDLIQLLGRALLFTPIIDKSWIAHQIIENSCSLRVSSKYGKQPEFLQEIKLQETLL